MAALEIQLVKAVEEQDIDEVRCLIEKGANINVFTSGKTPLGIAAAQGSVTMLELLINSSKFNVKPDKVKKKKLSKIDRRILSKRTNVKSKKSFEGNNGYYEVIYDDKSDDSESDVNNENVSSDEADTPEGMDNLSWDMELEDTENSDYEDVWSDQYRWYANILAKTCNVPSDLPYTCDVNLQDSSGRCAIHYAAENGHTNAVKALINAGCKRDIGDVDSLTPLHLAANNGHLEVIETLLSSGCHVNATTVDRLSPLHYAAAKGHADVVNGLLDAGANIDSLDISDRTPLLLAVSQSHYNVVETLINHGARLNIEDVKGVTALTEAAWHKSVPIVKLLLDAGAKIVPTHYLLHSAVLSQQQEMVTTLLEAGTLVNIRDHNGDTPLIVAAAAGVPDIANILLSYGALPDQGLGNSDKTALYCAVTTPNKPSITVIRTLVEGGADINKLVWGQSPLVAAIMGGKIRAGVALIGLGAEVKFEALRRIFKIESIPLIKAVVYNGIDLNSLDPNIKPPPKWPINTNSFRSWLQHTKFNPLGLAELSRIAVRKQAPKNLPIWLSSLRLPAIITRYLVMEELLEKVIDLDESYVTDIIFPREMFFGNGNIGEVWVEE